MVKNREIDVFSTISMKNDFSGKSGKRKHSKIESGYEELT